MPPDETLKRSGPPKIPASRSPHHAVSPQDARMKLLLPLLTALLALHANAAPIKILLIDGQNNHKWETTTPLLKAILEKDGLCQVTVATSPAKGADLSSFAPDFAPYQVVVSNYNGALWGDAMRAAFEKYVSGGGGFVAVHAANNSFPEWKAYNEMIGLGGWGGRTEKSGPYLRMTDGKWTADLTPGNGGHHGKQHEFLIVTRASDHPITAGLPSKWMHTIDELYDSLRGPAQNVTVLASAFSDPATGGTGRDEPMLMTISYGQGRVFHTALGHGPEAIQCAGFATTFQRGTEWAATGKVTQKVPADFPTETKVSSRP
jgi:type 1 glutamine amidotransferase